MTITTSTLTRAAGLSAIAAGLLFIVVQFVHPLEDVAYVTTTGWTVTHVLSTTMAVLVVVGISGMYLRQVAQMGLLGAIGYVLFAFGFLIIGVLTFVEAFVLPPLVEQAPRFVSDVLAISAGGTIVGDVAALETANSVAGVGYLLGGVLFGVAVLRAGALARWAALLLVVGTLATLALPLLPHAVGRLLALPVGVALAGLGFSLRGGERSRALSSARAARPHPAGLA